MHHSKLFLAAAAALASTGLATAQSYTAIPNGFSAADITPDGQIVVGSGSGGAYYWRWQVDPAPTFIGENDAVAVSDDGMFIAGNMDDPMTGANVAGIYDVQAGTWTSLGFLPNANPNGCPSLSSAYDMSGDGQTIVGLSWDGCSGRAFIWNSPGPMVELQNLLMDSNRASAIAADGSVIGGWAQASTRTPAQWDSMTLQGFVYDQTAVGEVLGVSDDGDRTVGNFNGGAFYKDGANPVTEIGNLIPGYIGWATDTNESGSRIVGFDSQLLDRIAWIWSPTGGFENLYELLTNLGVGGLPAFGLSVISKCTPDGETMVGFTQFSGAWIVELPICDASTTNRCQTAPNSVDATGALISSTGSLSISVNTFELSAGPVPNQPGIFYFGSSLLNGDTGLPFGDGWRCVGPDPVYRLPVEFASGNVLSHSLDFTTEPALSNISPGTSTYFQGWYRDPSGPGGSTFNLSDALEVVFCP